MKEKKREGGLWEEEEEEEVVESPASAVQAVALGFVLGNLLHCRGMECLDLGEISSYSLLLHHLLPTEPGRCSSCPRSPPV